MPWKTKLKGFKVICQQDNKSTESDVLDKGNKKKDFLFQQDKHYKISEQDLKMLTKKRQKVLDYQWHLDKYSRKK